MTKQSGAPRPAPQATTLDIDLGNTRLKFRYGNQRGALAHNLAEADAEARSGNLARATVADLLADLLPKTADVRRVRICSVLGAALDTALEQLVRERWGCRCEFAVSGAELAGVTSGYDEPLQLGVDRWLALVAGYHHFAPSGGSSPADPANLAGQSQSGRPGVLVADLGTAATLDYVTPQGEHLGGFIVPGAATMRQSLLRNTAEIRFEQQAGKQQLEPGRLTSDAVERGVVLALVRLLDAELERFDKLCHHNSRLILCGGGAEAVAPHLKAEYTLIPELVIDGLAFALP